jgi:hypothetical protein
VTDLIELAVGVVCLAAATAMWRRNVRLLSALLTLAGLTAAGHAIWSVTTG